jgi:hypothetical protein
VSAAKQFEIVPDDRRHDPGYRVNAGLTEALRSGSTVFVPGWTHNDANGYRVALKKEGFRVHGRLERDPGGLLLWAVPINGAAKP